jgi:hypothetical protein
MGSVTRLQRGRLATSCTGVHWTVAVFQCVGHVVIIFGSVGARGMRAREIEVENGKEVSLSRA